MNEVIRIFCENVRLLREENHLTLTKMAKKLGVTPAELRKIEHGVIPDRVTVEIVIRIYKHFGIDPKAQFEPL